MAEYIERAKIFSVWRSIPAPASVVSLAAAISQTPAADVVPVVHGRWGEYEVFPMTPSLNGYPCSNCGTHFSPSQIIFMRYCPRCGAKMDGEER